MQYQYSTKDVCSSNIKFDIKDNVICEVTFTGGCDGNLKAIGLLVEGMTPQDAAKRLDGIKCGNRGTSCADQLSKALSIWIKDNLT